MTPETGRGKADAPDKLLVSSWIQLEASGSAPIEVRREMALLGRDGAALGTVAAVVVDGHMQAATHLLLAWRHPELEYRLIPLPLIERVEGQAIRLRISGLDVSRLPRRPTA
jgi:hypothetical protein